MKRKILVAFLALVLCLCPLITASAAENPAFVYDDANLLSSAEEIELSTKLQSISQAYNAQIVVTTISSIEGGDIDKYVEYLYDTIGFGYGENHDGILLLLVMDIREFRILSNGAAADALTLDRINKITDSITPAMSDGDYANAFDEFADQCEYYLDGHINGFPFHFGKSAIISLIIGVMVSLIVSGVLKGQLKSVRKQERAHVYVKSCSMQITASRDLFLYREVSRRQKQSSNSSGSGSSRNVGGGSF